ncbi:MAG TPA: DUF1028 domain-containing protein [Oceanithermus profundus]|uniref:DUF1028 domain-containing protein n=1 Tax=Oceanithermus profundus TaxID=187137 RepID=A0A7C4V5Z2_9DEIN|nr:DUF1028 domain-containing protein [Oceanithermus profundus]
MKPLNTFSIVARDPESGDLGVAVASKFLAVGAVVPYARAGVGAVATQSYANTSYGPRAMSILGAGGSPELAHQAFANSDPGHAQRQYGIVAASGEAYSFTGGECHAWAGGRAGEGLAVQGNLLAGPEVVEALWVTFHEREDLPFPERLVAALLAGDRAGGDRRGRQSAALLVVGEGKGYGGFNDRWIDLRADDHPDPVPELERLLAIHRTLFSPERNARPLSEAEIRWVQRTAARLGVYGGGDDGAWSDAVEEALRALLGRENLEERYRGGPQLDEEVLTALRKAYGNA